MIRTENTTSQKKRSAQRRTLSLLEKTTAVALFLNAAIYFFLFFFVWLVIGPFVLPYLIFSLVTTLVATLILMRMRLALWLGVLVVLITSSLTLAETATSSTLIHPAVNPGHFGSLAFLFTLALIALVTGTAASIQNYRGPEPGSPGWLSPFVTGVSGLVVGMLVIAIVVAANPVGAAANASANGAPTVHTAGSRFLTNVVLVQKGSTLQVINDDGIEHILENGLWTASGVPDTQVEVGAPSVHSIDLKNGSVEIGPFSTAGIFHIHCTLHRGMNLTVVVQ